MKTAPWILPVALAVGLVPIYLLPNVGNVSEAAINMTLPQRSESWEFQGRAPSQEELNILSDDTEFAKAICLRARPGEVNAEGYLVPDRVDLSIVLSGHDINNSIHRPERCMPAQGHEGMTGSDVRLKLANGREFTARRLRSLQRQATTPERAEFVSYNCVTYYFFVGHDKITHDHTTRTLIDIKDRLVRGMDQRWAYTSASMWFGKVPWNIEKEITEKEADEKVQAFLIGLAEKQIRWEQIVP